MWTIEEAWELALLALCIWREAEGEPIEAKRAVAWCVRNRVKNGVTWDGVDYPSVILKSKQFSSFSAGNPRATKFPEKHDTAWQASLVAAEASYQGFDEDPTGGATHFYDRSIDDNPPNWTKDGALVHLKNIGNLRFWGPAKAVSA